MGITREKILGIARRAGIVIEEKSFFPKDLVSADEVFISSSIREIAPVVTVDGAPIGKGKPGETTLKLLTALRELAAASR
jgi:branched-subunit amino acid aminotransferase/4-amino-4-deoxychorismate lyase